MTRRRGGTQTRILWLLYCQLYDSPYPTYYLKNDKELLFYTDYVWICVCAVLEISAILPASRNVWQPAAFRFSPPAPAWSVAWFV